MELREIKALLVLMQEYGLTELEIDDKKKGKVRLVRASTAGDNVASASARVPAIRPSAQATGPRPAPATARNGGTPVPELSENQRLVTSPMVGTFYRASSPDAQPFVRDGDSVRKGQPLCIIEAMKMMNEIEAEFTGRVARILCENAQPVEYGQPLIIIEVA